MGTPVFEGVFFDLDGTLADGLERLRRVEHRHAADKGQAHRRNAEVDRGLSRTG